MTGTPLKHQDICDAISKAASGYPLTKVSYFGSYAEGGATDKSDLDLLVEFDRPSVPIWTICNLKVDLEELLGVKVDLVHAPIPEGSYLVINKSVVAYEN